MLAERNPVNSTRLSLPLVLAAVFLAALTVSATDDWAVDGAAWIVLQRESDTLLLERTCGLLRLPAAAGVGLFVGITMDPHISTIASPPQEISYPVERVLVPTADCARQWP